VSESRPCERRGHRQVEHTADVALELWGPDHAALLEQGALAVVELLTGGADVAATSTILGRGPLARWILRATGTNPDIGRIHAVYRELGDCLLQARLYAA
jgi:hypothetical protein